MNKDILALLLAFCFVAPAGMTPIDAGRVKPSMPDAKATPAAPPFGAVEQAIFHSVNRERTNRGLDALRWSEALAALARRQSGDMARLSFLGHSSATGQSYTERLGEAGIRFAANGENVVQTSAADPGLIHRTLMGSGGHRENILKPEFDEIGVGVSQGLGGTYYVAQDFVKSVTVRDEADARSFILAALEARRTRMGLGPLQIVDDVQETARSFALAKSSGREAPPIPESYGETRVHFYAGPDLDVIVGSMEVIPIERYRIAGIGVRFAQTMAYPGGAYHVCVFFLAGDPPR